MLEQNVEAGTGTRARLPGQPPAGKTGTAQDSGDAWFVGYTPQLATAVWMGAPDGTQRADAASAASASPAARTRPDLGRLHDARAHAGSAAEVDFARGAPDPPAGGART